VQTLVKIEGGQQSVPDTSDTFASLFVAYDSASAQRLWDDNVPAGLSRRDGDPVEDGLYGDLADVDFDEQVVGLWSAGESGSCPGWLANVRTREDGALILGRDEDTGGNDGCTDDYNPYRTVVALDRDAVPIADALASEGFTGEPPIQLRVFVAEYPPV